MVGYTCVLLIKEMRRISLRTLYIRYVTEWLLTIKAASDRRASTKKISELFLKTYFLYDDAAISKSPAIFGIVSRTDE